MNPLFKEFTEKNKIFIDIIKALSVPVPFDESSLLNIFRHNEKETEKRFAKYDLKDKLHMICYLRHESAIYPNGSFILIDSKKINYSCFIDDNKEVCLRYVSYAFDDTFALYLSHETTNLVIAQNDKIVHEMPIFSNQLTQEQSDMIHLLYDITASELLGVDLIKSYSIDELSTMQKKYNNPKTSFLNKLKLFGKK